MTDCGQVWLTEELAENMKDADNVLQPCLQSVPRAESLAVNSLGSIHEGRVLTSDPVQPEQQKTTALISSPALARVVREAIPEHEAMRDSLLSGDTALLSNAS